MHGIHTLERIGRSHSHFGSQRPAECQTPYDRLEISLDQSCHKAENTTEPLELVYSIYSTGSVLGLIVAIEAAGHRPGPIYASRFWKEFMWKGAALTETSFATRHGTWTASGPLLYRRGVLHSIQLVRATPPFILATMSSPTSPLSPVPGSPTPTSPDLNTVSAARNIPHNRGSLHNPYRPSSR